MTPAARAQAAIQVLDRWLAGEAAEKALTQWGRGARYAGSGDRAAVRDIVYDCLRTLQSCAIRGGAMSGRGLVLGWAREREQVALFDGSAHGPALVDAAEAGRIPTDAEAWDIPDALVPPLQAALGPDFAAVVAAMRLRAPVCLRVNAARGTRAGVQAALAAEGIGTIFTPLASFGLEVTEGARKIQTSKAYGDGLVELQDASSQAVVEALPLTPGMRVLDLCAGGGGKTLAMAARAPLTLFAHDAHPRRMADLLARASRAGVKVALTDMPEKSGPYDLILTDVPCSGSGSWRRDPEGKWRLTPERLAELVALQLSILARAAKLAVPGGAVAYVTCSFLRAENEAVVQAFLDRTPGWQVAQTRRFSPLQGGDGFFLSLLRCI